jgi:hypothetical protein
VFDVVTRAASAPATTTTSGWASQLVQTSYESFMPLMMPASVLPGLAAGDASQLRSRGCHLDPDARRDADDCWQLCGGGGSDPRSSGGIQQPDLHAEEAGRHLDVHARDCRAFDPGD